MDRNKENNGDLRKTARVVPYVGTWIEILNVSKAVNIEDVVPYVGTWIEI